LFNYFNTIQNYKYSLFLAELVTTVTRRCCI